MPCRAHHRPAVASYAANSVPFLPRGVPVWTHCMATATKKSQFCLSPSRLPQNKQSYLNNGSQTTTIFCLTFFQWHSTKPKIKPKVLLWPYKMLYDLTDCSLLILCSLKEPHLSCLRAFALTIPLACNLCSSPIFTSCCLTIIQFSV